MLARAWGATRRDQPWTREAAQADVKTLQCEAKRMGHHDRREEVRVRGLAFVFAHTRPKSNKLLGLCKSVRASSGYHWIVHKLQEH